MEKKATNSCLYTTSTKNTIEEYKKLCWALSKKFHIIVTSITSIMFVTLGLMVNPSFCVGIPIIIMLEYLSFICPVKKAYYSNQSAIDLVIDFEFYENHFLKKSNIGDAIILYQDLYRIIETETNIYLMLGANQGLILVKENLPKDLEKFLSIKVKKKERGTNND